MSEESKMNLSNLISGVLITLIGAGVVGIWALSSSVSRLDERVSLWTRIYESRFERLDQEFQEFRRQQKLGSAVK